MDINQKYNSPELGSFKEQITQRISKIKNHAEVQEAGKRLFDLLGYGQTMFVYNFLWAGIPSIQLPQDLMVKQEIIGTTSPM